MNSSFIYLNINYKQTKFVAENTFQLFYIEGSISKSRLAIRKFIKTLFKDFFINRILCHLRSNDALYRMRLNDFV